MQLSEMRDEVRANIRRDAGGISNDVLTRCVNRAQRRIANAHSFNEMYKVFTGSTIASQPRYGFPARMKEIYTLTLQSGASSRNLIYVPARRYDTLVPRPEQAGEALPTHYIDWDLELELYPIPDDAYTMVMRCAIFPVDLVEDEDESELSDKDELIVAGATAISFMQLREVEDATYWQSTMFDRLMVEAIRVDRKGENWVPVARGFTLAPATSYAPTNPWAMR